MTLVGVKIRWYNTGSYEVLIGLCHHSADLVGNHPDGYHRPRDQRRVRALPGGHGLDGRPVLNRVRA